MLDMKPAAEERIPVNLLPITVFFLFFSLVTFWPFLDSGFCTTDDMTNALETYKGFFEAAKAQGRIHFMSLHGITAFGIHRIGEALGGHLMVNALALLSVVGNAILFGYLLWLVSGSFHFGYFASFVWVATVQDSWSFFPLVASPVLYSLPFSFFLLALAFQEHFLRTGKTHLGWISSFFYFLSLQYSEMFICLFPVFPLLQARFGWSAFRVKHLLFSLLPVVIFSTAYFLFRMAFPSAYEGNAFTGTFAVSKILSTLLSYVSPSIPTWQFFAKSPIGSGHSFSDLFALRDGSFTFPFFLKGIANINTAIIVKALIFSSLAVYVTRGIARRSLAETKPILLLALFLMILPNLPFALNGKYQLWTCWLSGYTGTYYSTFGAALLSASAWCLVARFPRILSVPVIFLTTFIVTSVTGIHNETMAQTKRQEGLRWELMDQWMKTPEFRAVENGAVVYAPSMFKQLQGVFLVLDDYWNWYVKAKSGKSIRCIAQDSKFFAAAGKKPANAYFLKYSMDQNRPNAFLLFAPILDVRAEEDIDGSIRVFGDEADLFFRPPKIRRILLFQDEAGDRAIEIPPPSSAGDFKFHLKGKGVRLSSVFAVNNRDALRFESLHVDYGSGFHEVEQSSLYRWAWASGQDAELRIANLADRPIEAELSFQLVARSGDVSVVTVQTGDAHLRVSPRQQGSSLPVVLPLLIPPEGLAVRFHSETSIVAQTSPVAPRRITFGVFNPVVRKALKHSFP